MRILAGLNAPQIEAITVSPGPTQVLAGPGSGKTRVLTHRIAYLLEEVRVPAWHIMAVTFTNKAAREMLDRVERLVGAVPRGLTMGTFHATCARLLRRESAQLPGYDDNFVIFDTDDQKQVAKQALADLNLDDKRFPPARMLHGISSAKNELITPDIYAATNYISEVTRRVYGRYQAILQANNAMDFDDLLLNTVLLLDDRPDILEKYQARYQHILVDEFQDTNTVQYALLTRLAAAHRNLFVVGDADQSIYKWRGADFRNIHRFRQEYPDARTILLEQNYRSTQVILDAAKAVIRRNPDRVDKDLFTHREGGAPIDVQEAFNEIEEAQLTVETIHRLRRAGYSPGDCAVMYRTNAQSRALEEAFLREQMPYKLVGATRFYSRREIKDIIAYLRLVHNPGDSVSFQRVVNTPPRGIGKKSQHQLRSWAQARDWQPALALMALARDPELQHPFTGRTFNVLSRFGQLLEAWRLLAPVASVADLLDTILDQIGYRDYLEDGTDEGADRWANVMELRNVAGADPEMDLGQFLEKVALVSDVDDLENGADAPTLLTLHAAKGLEFPVVFITGLEEGVLPHSRSLDDGEELAEERRLFYVGLTRAKDRVYLSYAFRRSLYGASEVSAPSRFLADMPADLVAGSGASFRQASAIDRATSWRWSRDPASPGGVPGGIPGGIPAQQARRDSGFVGSRPTRRSRAATGRDAGGETSPAGSPFRTGQKVRHRTFGEGIVIESKPTGDDQEVIVAFAEAGIKRLAANFARLEIVGS